MLFTCQGTIGASCRVVVCFMASLYTNGRKCQYLCYKNIAQKSAADFIQIDETDIIYIIVYNICPAEKTVNAAQRLSEPF